MHTRPSICSVRPIFNRWTVAYDLCCDAKLRSVRTNGATYTVAYEPAESSSGLFGGNSNWRGPIWFPINYLLIEALQRFHHYYGDDFLVECPTGSGTKLTLWQIAETLSRRLISTFLRGPDGRRPVFGANEVAQSDPHWCDYLLFHEYFHGDTGAGVGASHQTGWTALVAKLLEQASGSTQSMSSGQMSIDRRLPAPVRR